VTAAMRAMAAGSAVLFTLPALCPAARAQTFRSKVEMVRVDVLVTENGRPVVGLSPSDFEILDNGVRQRVDFASFEQMGLNLVLALDTSASVAGPALAHLQQAGGAVLNLLTSADRAALVTFNQTVALDSPLTADLGQVRQAIDGVRPRGDTSLIDALFAGITVSEADVGRSLLLVFTDGADTSSFLDRQEVAKAAATTDVVVYAVTAGVPGRHTTEFLADIADRTGGQTIAVDSTRDMERAFVGIIDEFRHRYVLSYSPRGVAATGWHQIEVRAKDRRMRVKARAGYQRER
jgi:VWFA-related protein